MSEQIDATVDTLPAGSPTQAAPSSPVAAEAPASADTAPARRFADKFESVDALEKGYREAQRALSARDEDAAFGRQIRPHAREILGMLDQAKTPPPQPRPPEAHERERMIDDLIRDPRAFFRGVVGQDIEALRSETQAMRQAMESRQQQAWDAELAAFKSAHADLDQYAPQVANLLDRGYDLEDAYDLVKYRAGVRAEESARKKNQALTAGATMPSSVAPPSVSLDTLKGAKGYAEARKLAEARIERGG